MKILIYGGHGWIGQQVCQYLSQNTDIQVVHSSVRADNELDVDNELTELKPDRILSLIGRTHGQGFNTIDYLEQPGKLVENVKDNLFGPLVLAFHAKKHGIHYTYLGTGCIFSGYPEEGYDEDAKPDFFGSSYSVVKGYTDRLMHLLDDSVLNLRIRMPINSDVHPRNFITKIMTYKKICSIPNSMTVLPEMIPIIVDLITKKTVGTINLTNPGLISHNEILEMVKEIVDKDFVWENFSLEEQSKLLASGRSNNYLSTKKLESLYPSITPIKEAVRNTLLQMSQNYSK